MNFIYIWKIEIHCNPLHIFGQCWIIMCSSSTLAATFMKKIKAKTLIEICWISMNLKKDLKISISINLYHIILILIWYSKKWLLILTQWIPNDQSSMVLMSELYCALKNKNYLSYINKNSYCNILNYYESEERFQDKHKY